MRPWREALPRSLQNLHSSSYVPPVILSSCSLHASMSHTLSSSSVSAWSYRPACPDRCHLARFSTAGRCLQTSYRSTSAHKPEQQSVSRKSFLEKRNKGNLKQRFDLQGFKPSMVFKARGTVHIYIVATYREGGPTDNAKEFLAWLEDPARDKETSAFKLLRFALFGLGHSVAFGGAAPQAIDRDQAMGKRTFTRLQQLRAVPLLPRGEGDAAKYMEEDFYEWMDEMWPALESDTAET
eukprot:g26891.t1